MSGCSCADLLRGDEALVRMCWRHADVDDRRVRSLEPNVADQRGGVLGLADDLDTCLLEQTDDPFSGEHRVLGDDYSARDLGPKTAGVAGDGAAERADTIRKVR